MSSKKRITEKLVNSLEIRSGLKVRNNEFGEVVKDPNIFRENTEIENKMIEEFLRKRGK